MAMLVINRAFAQNKPIHRLDSAVNALTTELTNSNVTSYARIVGNNLTSSNNGFQLKFALIAFKDSAKWDQANTYMQSGNRFLRYTQVAAGVAHQKKGDDGTLQLTFTLYNRRDSSIYSYTDPVQEKEVLNLLRIASDQYYHTLISQGHTADDANKLSNAAYLSEIAYLYQKKTPKNNTDAAYVNILDGLTKQSAVFSNLSMEDAFKKWQKDFTDYAKKAARRPLLTLYPYSSYNYTYATFDKAGIGTTYLYSLVNNVAYNPVQLDLEANAYMASDSTLKTVNTKQRIVSFSLGVNRVMATDKQDKSIFEMKLAASFQHNAEANVKQKTPDIDLTVKYKLFKNLWVPVDLKYDSTKKSMFGYVSIATNLGSF